MVRSRREGEPRLLTFGLAPGAKVRLIVCCKACGHLVEPGIAELVERHGEALAVIAPGGPAAVRGNQRSGLRA